LGVRNILCLGGNYHNKGPKPRSYQPEQFDIDSVQMLWILRRLRDEGRHLDGREVEVRPKYFLGAAGSPFTLAPAYNAIRTEKKVNAGAQFIQTQMVFDTGRFTEWLEALDKRSLLDKVSILAGVCPLRNAEEARQMASDPGIYVPTEMLDRMERAAEKDRRENAGGSGAQVEEGVQIAAEIIDRLIHTPGIRGVHLMVGGQEESLPRILDAAGLVSLE
jgi:methylenetetrahydrofolate reductase (NADPH)